MTTNSHLKHAYKYSHIGRKRNSFIAYIYTSHSLYLFETIPFIRYFNTSFVMVYCSSRRRILIHIASFFFLKKLNKKHSLFKLLSNSIFELKKPICLKILYFRFLMKIQIGIAFANLQNINWFDKISLCNNSPSSSDCVWHFVHCP